MFIRYNRESLKTRETAEKGLTAGGRAVPYGIETILWSDGDYEEREIIMSGAFAESIRERDQRAIWNHNRDIVVGRRSKGTLRFFESDEGVDFELDFPDSPEGQSKFASVQRGDVDEVSFGFRDTETKEEFLKKDGKRIYKRTVVKGDLWEISPVTWAAYENNTSIAARAKDEINSRKALIDSKLGEASPGLDAAAAVAREQRLRDIKISIMKEGKNACT